jgi:Cu-Zn family superoxide dismutase
MKKLFVGAGAAIIAAAAISVSLLVQAGDPAAQADQSGARAVLRNASGQPVGVAKLTQEDGTVLVRVAVHDLAPGFHGFHVHGVAMCEAPFTSAGGHFNPGTASHPNHAADMPVLLVNADGTGEARFKTDRFQIDDLFAADGSALIIHASPDNYANIPTARYDPDPDATTLATGDAGSRVACGMLEGQ